MEQGLLGWLCAEDKVQGAESGAQPRESLQPPRRLASNVKGMGCTGVVMGTDPCPSSCGPSGDIHRTRTQSPGSGWAQRGSTLVNCGKNVRITFLSEKQGLQQQRGDPPGERVGYGLGAGSPGPCCQHLLVGTPCRGEGWNDVPGATAPGPGPPLSPKPGVSF